MAAPVPKLRLSVPEDHVQATEQLNRLLYHIEEWMRAQGQAVPSAPAGAPPHAAGGSFGVSGGAARMTGPKRLPPPHHGPQPVFHKPMPTPPAPTIDAIRDDGTTYARTLATALTDGQVDLSQPGVIGKTLTNIADSPTRVALSATWATSNVALAVHFLASASLSGDVNIGGTVTTIKSISVTLPNDGVKRYIVAWGNIVAQFNSVGSSSTVRGTVSITDGTTTAGFSHQIFSNLSGGTVNENVVFEPFAFLGPYVGTGQTITVTFQATGSTLIVKTSAATSETGALTIATEMFASTFPGA